MKKRCMKKFLVYILFFCSTGASFSQEDNNYKGTIKVQKKGHLLKTVYDNVNFRLVGIDQYGNILDTAVLEFKISVTIRGIFHTEKNTGPILSANMQALLDRADNTTKIFFDNIKAKDRDGTLIDMPKFQYTQDFRPSDSE